MPSIFKILLSAIVLNTQVLSCSITGSYDLTFFVTSTTNDMLTCGSSSPIKAKISAYSMSGPPVLLSIWDTISGWGTYHCIMTKYFFVSGIPTGALADAFADNLITMKINDVQVSTISSTSSCTFQKSKDIFAYIKPGLNKLYIDVYNSEGPGYLGYRLTIKTHLV